MTDNQVFINLPSDKLVALVAYGEARGEGPEGMMAVLNVINNRAPYPEFWDMNIYNATTSPYHAVALKEKQFSVFNFGDSNRPIMVSIAENFDRALSSTPILAQAYQLAQMLVSRVLTDNTAGAVYYHTPAVTPSWAASFIKLGQIGNHIFYATTASLDRFRQAAASVVSTVTSVFETPGVSGSTNLLLLFGLGVGGILLLKALIGGRRS